MLLVSEYDDIEPQDQVNHRIQFDDIFNGSFTVKRTSLVWVGNGKTLVWLLLSFFIRLLNSYTKDPRDGIYTYRDPISNDILLESIENRESQVFVKEKDLVSLYNHIFFNTYGLICTY